MNSKHNTDGIINKLVMVFARQTIRSYRRAFAPATSFSRAGINRDLKATKPNDVERVYTLTMRFQAT
jgi:hypothetical protein